MSTTFAPTTTPAHRAEKKPVVAPIRRSASSARHRVTRWSAVRRALTPRGAAGMALTGALVVVAVTTLVGSR